MIHSEIDRIRHDLAVIMNGHSNLMSRNQYIQDVMILLREVNRLQIYGQRDPSATPQSDNPFTFPV